MLRKIAIFLVIGILILGLDLTFSKFKDEKIIYVTEEEIYSLMNSWALQVGRNPNPEEAKAVIDNLIEEEILYREALRLGLDANDQIIKRRLAQKLMFLKQESKGTKLTDLEISEFYENNPDKYLIPEQYDFTHIYFSKEDEGLTRAQNAKAHLDKSQEIKGDVFFLGKNFTNKSPKELRKDFGINFSSELENLKLNEWSKPIESTYGSHLIKLVGFQAARIPELEEIKPRVMVDLELERKDSTLSNYLNELKEDYEVIISRNLKQTYSE